MYLYTYTDLLQHPFMEFTVIVVFHRRLKIFCLRSLVLPTYGTNISKVVIKLYI